MPDPTNFDLIVIGAGPGGYIAAIRAAQLGFKTACVEREALGGTCLNVGCIPSKALLDSTHRLHDLKHGLDKHGLKIDGTLSVDLPKMLARKDEVIKGSVNGIAYLFKKHNITHLKGHGRILNPTTVEVKNGGSSQTMKTRFIVIATGSAPIQIPSLPFDGVNVISSTEALTLKEAPKRLAIVGAGYIGVEMGSVWSRLGSEVILFEFLDRALPGMDRELAGQLQRQLEKQGMKFRFKTVAEKATPENGKVKLAWKSGDQAGVEEVDKVLVCVGRRPVTDNLGLAEIGVQLDQKGFVTVDPHFQTSVKNIYAIGDVIGGLMLAHKAEEEGVACVEHIAGKGGHVNYKTCPGVVYTYPELAQVGLSEEDAAAKGPVKVGKFPFSANGRARGMDATEGQVKIVADANTDRILGVAILHAHASDIIAEAVVAMEFAATAEDLAKSFHAHPTLPEAIKQAALAVNKAATQI